ncbi:Ff.00g053580.m01.CDS01 [Fusarium sp. VM40]|nr:Ff.00g053580.m01.CDS01 [Fusarium sp. VM40]
MIFWYNICAEIRHMILVQLARAVPHEKGAMAAYARVSKEWQTFFEPYSFRSLKIQSTDLKRFQEIFAVHRRRAYLQHLGLKTTIPEHKLELLRLVRCTDIENLFAQMTLLYKRRSEYDTHMPWIEKQEYRNNVEFDNALRSLFHCLTYWTVRQVHFLGIKLEIIADSKSHWQEAATVIQELCEPMVIHIPDRLVVSSYCQEKTLRAAELDFHFLLGVMNWELPVVQVISEVSIPKSNIHQLEPNSVVHILNSLPRLRTFIWAIRPHVSRRDKRRFYEQFQETVHMWPKSLTRVGLTQSSSTRLQRRGNPELISLVSTLSTQFKDLEITSTYSDTNELLFWAKAANVSVKPDSRI